MKRTVLILATLAVACGVAIRTPPPPVPHQPPPPIVTVPSTGVVGFDTVLCAVAKHDDHCDVPIAGGRVVVTSQASQISNGDGYNLWAVADTLDPVTIVVDAPGYEHYDSGPLHPKTDLAIDHNFIQLRPDLPPQPTRDQVTNVCLSFQGLTVRTAQFGTEPYFESSLAWHDVDGDRQAIYAAKHAAKNAWCPGGDTHAIIHIPFGGALYDEPGQFYTADKFGPRDWTNGLTRLDPKFLALVLEVRRAGFIPIITACGDGDKPENYACAMQQTPLILDALQQGPRDLRQDVLLLPGYDGVFYGWGKNDAETRRQINSWFDLIRRTCANCILALEHGTGHIPLGEGPGDWEPGGDMNTRVDVLLSEFNDDTFDDSVWQIAARTIGPLYRRPAEQPAWDDPGAPFGTDKGQFYLRFTGPRGPIKACAFEFGLYSFVRFRYDSAHVAQQRQYFINRGYTCGG